MKKSKENSDDFFKEFYLSSVLGFGINFGKYFGIEILPEIGPSDALKSMENKSIKTGAFLNFIVYLESIINNQR